jgi:hypothetical protein
MTRRCRSYQKMRIMIMKMRTRRRDENEDDSLSPFVFDAEKNCVRSADYLFCTAL